MPTTNKRCLITPEKTNPRRGNAEALVFVRAMFEEKENHDFVGD
jgi:hypothetical protein